jgi:hypothetical protein
LKPNEVLLKVFKLAYCPCTVTFTSYPSFKELDDFHFSTRLQAVVGCALMHTIRIDDHELDQFLAWASSHKEALQSTRRVKLYFKSPTPRTPVKDFSPLFSLLAGRSLFFFEFEMPNLALLEGIANQLERLPKPV